MFALGIGELNERIRDNRQQSRLTRLLSGFTSTGEIVVTMERMTVRVTRIDKTVCLNTQTRLYA